MDFVFSKEIKNHKNKGLPVLALESTILAHGMPYPDNYNFAKEVEKNCRDIGVAPATIAILDGRVHVGLNDRELKIICCSKKILKISKRDLPFCNSKKPERGYNGIRNHLGCFKSWYFCFFYWRNWGCSSGGREEL